MIDRDLLESYKIPIAQRRYDARDVILYNLGLSLGFDPLDRRALAYVRGDSPKILPTFATVVATPGFWQKDPATGIDWRSILHGEQSILLHRPLPRAAHMIGETKVDGVIDKGPSKPALVYSSRRLYDADTNEVICEQRSTSICRGQGGFGGPAGPVRPAPVVPGRAPDWRLSMRTSPQSALIYQLSGDDNPLHLDPDVAMAAGFDRPILHGLSTFGIAAYAVAETLCAGAPDRVTRIDVRFTAPVFPGETVSTEIWKLSDGIGMFRTMTPECGNKIVLDNGYVEHQTAE